MIKINLVDTERNPVETIQVESAVIAEAACIEYKGKYYIYSRLDGKDTLLFMEVNPPVHIPKQIKLNQNKNFIDYKSPDQCTNDELVVIVHTVKEHDEYWKELCKRVGVLEAERLVDWD